MKPRTCLISLVVLGLLNALYWSYQRARVESRNKAMEIVVDMDEIRGLAAGNGVSLSELLRRFKNAGATSVAITEDTIESLRERGQIAVVPSSLVGGAGKGYTANRGCDHGEICLLADSKEAVQRLMEFLPRKYPVTPRLVDDAALQGRAVLCLPSHRELIEQVGLGLDPNKVNIARRAGLNVVGRLNNYPSLNQQAIEEMVCDLDAKKVETAIFAADEIPGYKDLLPSMAEALIRHHVHLGCIEFAKQRGDIELSDRLRSRIIRVHSIDIQEMNTLQPEEAVERFVRAARERNIRLCYVRLLPQMKQDAVGSNLTYVRRLAAGMRRSGFVLQKAHPFEDFLTPRRFLAVTGMGVVAASILLLVELCALPAAWSFILLAVGVVALTGGLGVIPHVMVKLTALLAACVYPVLGYCISGTDRSLQTQAGTSEPVNIGSAFRHSLGCLLKCSLATLAGAAMVVGLLAETKFMVKTDQFLGIKAAQLLPVMTVAFLLITGLCSMSGLNTTERWRECRRRIYLFLQRPLLVSAVVAGIAAIGFVALWLARTGNEPGVGVSPIELKLRAILENLMVARPRTKEFLLGHPAFLIGVGLACRGWRSWAFPLILLGVVGQTSVLNTFCHIHTPLALSLLRTLNGLWLGIVLGWIVWVMIFYCIPESGKANTQESTFGP